MPIKVVKSKADLDQIQMVVCQRVNDLPIPFVPAKILRCSNCKERVWLADNSPQHIPIWCMQCAEIAIAVDGEEPMISVTQRMARDVGSYVRLQRLLDAAVKREKP